MYTKNYHIKKNLINWYDLNKRNLPWRVKDSNKFYNPYRVLVSEIMLQQTSVSTVKKKYGEFIKLWPNIRSLCNITEAEILRFWSGLGYYNRALNLLKCVKIIESKYNYNIPSKTNDLLNLPGIGEYTSKAIQGIVFNKPVMPVDANIERIVVRLNGLSVPVSKIKKLIKIYSEKLILKERPGDMIQSLMDFGSLVCKPRNPNCPKCCIKKYCKAYKKNLTSIIPIKITSTIKIIEPKKEYFIGFNSFFIIELKIIINSKSFSLCTVDKKKS